MAQEVSSAAPRKPPTPFMLFAFERRVTLRADHPELSFAAFPMKLSQEWKHMTNEQKAPYVSKAEVLKAEFLVKKAQYDAEHPNAVQEPEANQQDSDDDSWWVT